MNYDSMYSGRIEMLRNSSLVNDMKYDEAGLISNYRSSLSLIAREKKYDSSQHGCNYGSG